jgi:hypothetical protein
MKRPAVITIVLGGVALLIMLSYLVFFEAMGFSPSFSPSLFSTSVPPQARGTPVFISTGDSEAGQDNGIAFDASGAAMVVWEETDGVLTKRYEGKSDGKSNSESKAQGWGPTTKIAIPPQTEPVATRLVSIAPGHMLAFWTARNMASKDKAGWPYGVWSATYSQQGADTVNNIGQWTAAVPVSKAPPGMSSNQEQIAVAAGKDAASAKVIAVWQEWGCTGVCIENTSVKTSRIMSATYNVASGWSTPIQVNDASTPIPEEPEVSIDQQGRAVAVWLQVYSEDGTKALLKEEGLRIRRLYYSVLQPGGIRWTTPQLVHGIEPTASVSKAVVRSNAAGDTVLAWAENKGRKESDMPRDTQENCEVVMATRLLQFDSNKSAFSLETPKRLSEPAGDFACPIVSLQAAIDTSGNALVGWTAYAEPERDHVAYAAKGQPWRKQLALPYSDSGSITQLRIAFVSPGRAVVIGTYAKHDQPRRSRRSHIVKHHFDADKWDAKNPSRAWSASQRIDWPDGASAQQPTLAVHPNGQAISSWRQMAPGKLGISAYVWDTNTVK